MCASCSTALAETEQRASRVNAMREREAIFERSWIIRNLAPAAAKMKGPPWDGYGSRDYLCFNSACQKNCWTQAAGSKERATEEHIVFACPCQPPPALDAVCERHLVLRASIKNLKFE
jgi:hypothetical protein